MFKMAIIGCGTIVQGMHVDALKLLTERVKVTALADPSSESLAMVGKSLAIPEAHWYSDYRKMLSKEELDLVDIATPHFLHEPIAVECARARVNIVLEKPMATTLDEAARILEAVDSNGVHLCIMHNYRYYPANLRAFELLKSDALGERFLYRNEGLGWGWWRGAQGYDPDWRTRSARAGGGALIDNGYHNVYLAREMIGSPVRTVYAKVGTYVQNIEVDDTALLLLGHENGAVTSIQIAWSIKANATGVNEVHGTRGSISFSLKPGHLAVFYNDKGEWEHPDISAPYPVTAACLFDECLEALETGKPMPVDGREGRRNLEIILAAYQSARTGKVVEV